MKKENTNDIKAALQIIELINKDYNKRNHVKKEELLKNQETVASKSSYNRALRELVRLGILNRLKEGYKINRQQIKNGITQIKNYNTRYLSNDEIIHRLKSYHFFTRNEINTIIPELSIQQIDNIILNLQNAGYIKKYGGKNTRGKYTTATADKDIFISDIIGKIATLYKDVVFCYSTALEYYNLSRYDNSKIIYIAGKNVPPELGTIANKKIKNITLPYPETGIAENVYNKIKIKITDFERTLIDCIRYPKYAIGWENIIHALKQIKEIDEEKILKYLLEFQNSSLISKVGLLFDNFAESIPVSKRMLNSMSLYKSQQPTRLIRNLQGKINKTWNIYVPDNFFNDGKYS